ncbi:MAG: hypothetical protein M1814_005957 [Vezdaea aestivalis]|nr:MAG: hypothetical protein M1814_005957 [Vezdaea aestivalis]
MTMDTKERRRAAAFAAMLAAAWACEVAVFVILAALSVAATNAFLLNKDKSEESSEEKTRNKLMKVRKTRQEVIDSEKLVAEKVKSLMEGRDASHDFCHIERVCYLAEELARLEAPLETEREISMPVIRLACLVHDLEDRKYPPPASGPLISTKQVLSDAGVKPGLADVVVLIASNVSYSHEKIHEEAVDGTLEVFPELGIVQDADRLDALGAVGISRAFVYGGAKGRDLNDSIVHFGEKLEDLEGRMKTGNGRRMAAERTARIRLFKQWFEEESEHSK